MQESVFGEIFVWVAFERKAPGGLGGLFGDDWRGNAEAKVGIENLLGWSKLGQLKKFQFSLVYF